MSLGYLTIPRFILALRPLLRFPMQRDLSAKTPLCNRARPTLSVPDLKPHSNLHTILSRCIINLSATSEATLDKTSFLQSLHRSLQLSEWNTPIHREKSVLSDTQITNKRTRNSSSLSRIPAYVPEPQDLPHMTLFTPLTIYTPFVLSPL